MVTVKLNLVEGFENLIMLLKIVGCWSFPNENVYKVYKFFMLLIGCLFTMTSAIFVFKNVQLDPIKSYETSFFTIAVFEANVKHILFRKNFKKIEEAWKLIQQKEFQPRNHEQKKLLEEYIKIEKNIFKIYFSVFLICMVVAVTGAILLNKGNDFPTNHWVPFDYHKSVLFQILFVFFTFALIVCTFTNCSIDACFYLCLLHIISQCILLSNTLRNVHDLNKLNENHRITKNKNKDEVMNDILIECEQHYLHILK